MTRSERCRPVHRLLGRWAVQGDVAAPSPHVLVQTGQFRAGLHVPRCLADGVRARDLVAEVVFKPLAAEDSAPVEVIGLWTIADSVSAFDDLRVEAL